MTLTQDKILNFMLKMADAMRKENIPIVTNITYDFPLPRPSVQNGDNNG